MTIDPSSAVLNRLRVGFARESRSLDALQEILVRRAHCHVVEISQAPEHAPCESLCDVAIATTELAGEVEALRRQARTTIIVGLCLRRWSADAGRDHDGVRRIADPVTLSLQRLLADMPISAQSPMVVVEQRPPEDPYGDSGPLDCLRIHGSVRTEIVCGHRRCECIHHLLETPHTRCRAVTCSVSLERELFAGEFIQRMKSVRHVFVAASKDGFSDTASVAEYFRDRDGGLGCFAETVLLEDTVTVSAGLLSFTFACSDLACLRELAPTLGDEASSGLADTRVGARSRSRRSGESDIRVGVIGLGTLGRRIADAVVAQPDMRLVGVGVRRNTPAAAVVKAKGIDLFFTGHASGANEWRAQCSGQLADLLTSCDVVADCRQAGLGATFLKAYEDARVKTVFQGGEAADAVEITYNSFVNCESARGARVARITSCNTTGLARLLTTLQREFGVERADAALIRCSTDPDKANAGLINGALPTCGESHHGRDLRAIAPSINIQTQAVAVSMTFGHVQCLTIRLKRDARASDVLEVLERTPRIIVDDFRPGTTTGRVVAHDAYRRQRARCRGDRPELLVWRDTCRCDGRNLKLITAIDMQSITIPDTIDCIRMMTAKVERAECLHLTDERLAIARPRTWYDAVGVALSPMEA